MWNDLLRRPLLFLSFHFFFFLFLFFFGLLYPVTGLVFEDSFGVEILVAGAGSLPSLSSMTHGLS
ncbi:uncharacterized protein BO80DRAFT_142083 [Aspergillus ibericus CBS 121593]|uniref:Uncharacterized protein n=1 Tax=Aspergillus ibericus CBS 121593 TaxID=1448316 RepID=A0A395GW51_9EURO|nr:hypothetical protein BO80DRAFT_142083 [Aspergillus ibericus CBS 121593]RAK99248.1 hypothetical protein BO80DRAFT_142083 [Aspergillus ibericus CBS 121593]